MSFWVYKCNDTGHALQVCQGDWEEVFSQTGEMPWGNTKELSDLAKLGVGDVIIAYQTERNEIVGLAEVVRLRRRGAYRDVVLRPVERLGAKVRPLKDLDKRIAALSCFRQANVATIYPITTADAWHFLKVASAYAGMHRAIRG